jgi:hypothetical protein
MEVSGQLHAPGRFTPRERAPSTHWVGGCVGGHGGEEKYSQPPPGIQPRTPIVQPVA